MIYQSQHMPSLPPAQLGSARSAVTAGQKTTVQHLGNTRISALIGPSIEDYVRPAVAVMLSHTCTPPKIQRRDHRALEGEHRLAYNKWVEFTRQTEYPLLNNVTYLDHGGTTLPSNSLIDTFCTQMKSSILSNPHSDASRPSFSAHMIEQTRQKVLTFFSANPDHWEVVYTANATAAIKLVMECFAGHEQGFDYIYHSNAHTSLVGVREQSQHSRCLATVEETEYWLSGGKLLPETEAATRPVLFAYSAQSNMNGERLPLWWASRVRKCSRLRDTYTLLDAAALVPTSPLSLSDHTAAPDFVALSFYKIFGFPDLGALIVRKSSAQVLQRRRYFGEGTTEMIGCIGTPWAERKKSSVHAYLEDGTIAIRSILALSCAIDTHRSLFDDMAQVSKHTGWLAKTLHDRLAGLKHANGIPLCHIYKAPTSIYGDPGSQGATVTFNIRLCDGTWMSSLEVGSLLRENNIHVRSGSLCNPAGMASALGLSTHDLRAAFDSGFRCNQSGDDVRGGVPYGMIRATLGAISTLRDVEILGDFFEKHLLEHSGEASLANRGRSSNDAGALCPSTTSDDGKRASAMDKTEGDGAQRGSSLAPMRRVWQVLFGCYPGARYGKRAPVAVVHC